MTVLGLEDFAAIRSFLHRERGASSRNAFRKRLTYAAQISKTEPLIAMDSVQTEGDYSAAMDVPYRFFSTRNRRLLVADTRGLETIHPEHRYLVTMRSALR